MNIFDIPQEVLRNPAPEALQAPDSPLSNPTPSGIEFNFSTQLRAHYEPLQHAMWSRWNPAPRPCFNSALLADIRNYHNFLERTNGQIECLGDTHAIEYVILASDKPGVFNLGGDLDLFKKLIAEQDRAELLRYGHACIDVLYSNYCAFDLSATTISLVQGDALGGGFEAALSGDMRSEEHTSELQSH